MLAALLGILAYLPLWLSSPYRPDVIPFLVAVIPAGAAMFVAFRMFRSGKVSIGTLLVVGLLVRVAFIVQPPTLSEDVYRYLWDGSLSAAGVNPYAQPPVELGAWQARHSELYTQMAHVERTSIYPPAAQLLFIATQTPSGPSLARWKFLILLAETGLFWLLLRTQEPVSPQSVFWLLNPLVILEFYSSAHLDIFAAGLVAAALILRSRAAWAGVALGTAVLIKIYPLVYLPSFVAHLSIRRSLSFFGGFASAIFVLTGALWGGVFLQSWRTAAPILQAGSPWEPLQSWLSILVVFQENWQFNSLLFSYMRDFRQVGGYASALVFLAVALHLSRRGNGRHSLRDSCLLITLSLYVFSHTVHPWYVSWALVFALIHGRPSRAMIYLSLACLSSYLFYLSDPPTEPGWLLWAEWLPFYLLLLAEFRSYHGSYEGKDAPVLEGPDRRGPD